jgi:NADPH-dependent 2,4-dienoyl-CoA reductase/sulfur reductase-like enzyme
LGVPITDYHQVREKMKNFDVVIIGGGPSGIVTAATAKKQHPDKSMLMIKQEGKGVVPCGIPYVFHELGDLEKNAMGPKPFVDQGGEVLVDTVSRVDTKARRVYLESGEQVGFEKLIFATGSSPIIPTFIKGHDFANGVEYVSKSYEQLARLKTKTDAAHKIIILGSGFTAVEMAEQLAQDETKEVHLVFRAQYCLHKSFSPDFAKQLDQTLRQTRIHLHAQCQIKEITGNNGQANGILLDDGRTLDADLVIIGMGFKSNSELAREAGLKINERDQIVVDNYLRTTADQVYAVGDCAQTLGFITGRTDNVMLASTAAAEARVLGYNLYKIRIKRNFPATLSVFSTELNGKAFASVGAIEQAAQAANIEYVIGEFSDVDRHPGTLPGTQPLAVKLVVMPICGQIIGGEISGGKVAGELINVLALAIQKHVTVYELLSFQIGTHPLLTTAPTKPVLIKAAEAAINKIGL